MEGDPEATAQAYINDSLPEVFLDQIGLASAQDVRHLIDCLARRYHQASLECDEIERFVNRNKTYLRRTALLDKLAEAVSQRMDDEKQRAWMLHVLLQIGQVLHGHPERLDMMSSRLLWLCLALDNHVTARIYRHDQVVAWLRRAPTRRRMTPRAVQFLAIDYHRNADTLPEPRTEYVMIISECAMLADDERAMTMAAILLRNLPPPSEGSDAWLDVRHRLRLRLSTCGAWGEEDEAALQRAVLRFSPPVADDDF
ncbi:hypothetical protein ACH4UT_29015 [Streptomyces sp. NPDC020799]|uniref:hypothetical protein n=1 Tax=Streptomyces sp. NPDC020799 TaxID=3365091 RepID=UPI0037A5CC04